MIHFYRISLISLQVIFAIVLSSSTCSRINDSTSSKLNTSDIPEEEIVKYHECQSFIREGVKYVFSKATDWHRTIPMTYTVYDYGEVIFEGGYMYLAFGDIQEAYSIISSIYEEVDKEYRNKQGGACDYYRAQFKLKSDGLYYYARLELGPNHSFQISSAMNSAPKLNYYPKEYSIPALHDIRHSMFYCNR